MRGRFLTSIGFAAAALLPAGLSSQEPAPTVADSAPPPVAREFRGAWVASVANIDWPSRPGLSVWEQQEELIHLLNRAVALKMNAIVLQVRPACDALYESRFEPWSEYLTGQQGKAPEPAYDPLAFAIQQAHDRGLELHAWFNPFRARHPSAQSEVARTHVSLTKPELVRQYGRHLWLDPGERAARDYSIRVVLDVVRRYDIDGVQIDDYFYPYKERDSSGVLIDFPDSATFAKYAARGGELGRDDWRRNNVDVFVRDLYAAIKRTKPRVKFGVSPFGIWRPGFPEQVRGFDPYVEIFADARKWLVNGWVDYFAPQLYWPIASDGQSYPVLLRWWVEQNVHARHLWPGNFTSRVGAEDTTRRWGRDEVLAQIRVTREQPGATGNIHFSMKALVQDRDSLTSRLIAGEYAEPALVPATRWLDSIPPARPSARVLADSATGGQRVTFAPGGRERIWLWIVRARVNGSWISAVVPGQQRTVTLTADDRAPLPDLVAVSGVDRSGNESRLRMVRVAPREPAQ